MSQPGASGQPNGQAGNPPVRAPPMYRPEQMRNLSILTQEERTTFERGLAALWQQHDRHPEGSQERAAYRKKIIDFGPVLVKKVNERKAQQQAAQQQAQQQQGGPPPGPDSGSQAQPVTTNPNPQAATAALANAQKGPGMIQMLPSTMNQQMAQQGQPQQISAAIRQHLAQMTWIPPRNVVASGPEVAAKWVADAKRRYAQSLMNMENARTQLAKLDAMLKTRQENGQPLSEEDQKLFDDKRLQFNKMYEDGSKFVDIYRRAQKSHQAGGAPGGAPGGDGGQQPRPGGPSAQQMKQEPSNQGMMAGVQGQQAEINGAFDAAKKESIAAAGRMPGATGLPTGLQQQAQGPGGQGTASPGGQAQVKIEPGTQQRPHPPPINTQIPAGAISAPNTGQLNSAASLQQQIQHQQQQQNRVQTPQTATQPQGVPASGVPFTHQKAIEQANILARANSQTGSISGPAGAIPVTSAGTPQSGGGNNSAGVIGAPAQQPQALPQQAGNIPHAHPTNQALQAKLPIPKQLPERATQPPVPVALGGGMAPGRPTMTGGSGIAGGVMSQPVVARTPAVTMESDSERVMNKKKLDELVRQVCGGTAEDQEVNLLSPDVEESVLNLADSFVDNVLHTACRNAKERGSKVLEVRDIQLVLERAYNIRIPGFSSDELRTIRKVQPLAAWINKMSAVQAAKVTQGKGDV